MEFADVLHKSELVYQEGAAPLQKGSRWRPVVSVFQGGRNHRVWEVGFQVWQCFVMVVQRHVLVVDCSSGVSGCVNTGGDLVTSRLASANDVGGMILVRGVDAVLRPNVVVGVGMLEGVRKKLKQSIMIKCSIYMLVCVSAELMWLKTSWFVSCRHIRRWRRFKDRFPSVVMYN